MTTRYAITGHTQGIGKKLFELLSPNAIGFSKSTGYDITKEKDRYKIIDQSNDCDVFINNATDGFGQTQLFIDLISQWKDRPEKTIINVGSRIAEIVLPQNAINLLGYQAEKLILKEMSLRLPSDILCKVNYRWFAYVGTERILAKYPHFTENDYISVEKACEIILS